MEANLIGNPSKRQAISDAARFHRGFAPASNLDGFTEMMGQSNEGASGPYGRDTNRRTPPWTTDRTSQHPPRAGAPRKTRVVEEDFGMGDQRDRQGRLRTYEGVEICYTYARAGGCTNPCPHDRAHRCEWCGGTDHANDGCPTLVENEGTTTATKGKKGKATGKGGKGKKRGGKGGKGKKE